MIQVGLVGVGFHWERYRPALSQLRQPIHVEAVYDPVFARAESAARDLEADPVHGISALAARGNVDAILVMDPGWTRTSVLSLLSRQEKPVFFAPWLIDGTDSHQRLAAIQSDSDVRIVPAMWRRFLPAAIRLQELIATEIGQPREINVDLTTPAECRSDVENDTGADNSKQTDSGQCVSLESIVGWLDFCRNLFRAFPVSASLTPKPSARDDPKQRDQSFELNIKYPPAASSGNDSTASNPERRHERKARLKIGLGIQRSAADFTHHLLTAGESPAVEAARSAIADSPRPGIPKIELHCERGIADMTSETRLEWQSDSTESTHEDFASERTEEEIMLDIFCRRVVGGLVPVADLNDVLKPIQLLRSCLESS
jgi:predicted dehydrogenase